MLNESEVLDAIRELAATTPTGEVRTMDLAEALGVSIDDEVLSAFLARAEAAGLIETVDEVDQLQVPLVFRYTP